MRKSKLIVFLDIDGTLYDASYVSNDPGLKKTIVQMGQMGYIFALNSNRSLEDMLTVAKQFGINGPLIGENGIFAYDVSSGKTDYFLDESQLNQMTEAKKEIEALLLQSLGDLFGPENVVWKNVDTVKFLSESRNQQAFKDGTILALNNRYRRYTISTHLFKYTAGKLTPLDKLQAVVDMVNKLNKYKSITITSSRDFSNVLMYSNQTSKRKAIKVLLKEQFNGINSIAIGDEMSDQMMIKDIGKFLTVANASAKVKAAAEKTAHKDYTAGVRELIEQLSNT